MLSGAAVRLVNVALLPPYFMRELLFPPRVSFFSHEENLGKTVLFFKNALIKNAMRRNEMLTRGRMLILEKKMKKKKRRKNKEEKKEEEEKKTEEEEEKEEKEKEREKKKRSKA